MWKCGSAIQRMELSLSLSIYIYSDYFINHVPVVRGGLSLYIAACRSMF